MGMEEVYSPSVKSFNCAATPLKRPRAGNKWMDGGVCIYMRAHSIVALLVCVPAVIAVALPSPQTHKPGLPVIATAQYDNARTGANLLETTLTPENVNANQFGRVASFSVDGDVYAQPLYLPHVEIPGKGAHNVVLVATERDSVYAFDADSAAGTILWKTSFVDAAKNITPVSAGDVRCPFIQPDVGITSTPVIDVASKTIFVLARTREAENGNWVFRQKLHALDITSGAEKFGGPVEIRASYQNGKGRTDFDPLRENQRAALLLAKNNVYITWASSCDVGPYTGWVISYNAQTLKQTGALNVAPGAGESGIWQADAGPAADSDGNVFLITGNGRFTAASGGHDYGDSVLKIALMPNGLVVRDYFTPSDQAHLNDTDGDFGSGSPLLLPDQTGDRTHVLLAAGKSSKIYELDRDNLGQFHAGEDSNAVQVIAAGKQSFGAPAYWNGHVYYFLMDDYLRDYLLRDGKLSMQPVAKGPTRISDPGTPAVSANGPKDGIVWILSTKVWNGRDQPAILFAYDATNVGHELYNSGQNGERDRANNALRFTIPTVANGRVYVPTKGHIDVYGLLTAAQRKNK
jgi:hypothetical protein